MYNKNSYNKKINLNIIHEKAIYQCHCDMIPLREIWTTGRQAQTTVSVEEYTGEHYVSIGKSNAL